jgi:thiol-disulfide isomerase/thioredoxin
MRTLKRSIKMRNKSRKRSYRKSSRRKQTHKNQNQKQRQKQHRKQTHKNHKQQSHKQQSHKQQSHQMIQYGGVPVQFYAKNPHIRELTPDDFNNNNQITDVQMRPGIVMFYADWCPHCNSEETQKYWNDTGLRIDSKNGWVGAMNCATEMNKPISQKIGINAFPTILFVDKLGNVIN